MTFKWDLGLQPNWTILSNGTFTPQGAQLWHIILKSMHKCRRYSPDKLNHLTFSCDLDLQPTWTNFQVTLLLPKKNNHARLFWNPCINVEDMARTSSIYWPFYHRTFKCDLDLPHTWINVSNGTATPQREQLYQIILKFMHKCRSYGCDKRNICDLQVWPWPSTYLKCFKLHFSASWRQLCQIILKSMHKCRSYGLDQSVLMHARTHVLMHARTYTEKIVTAMSRLTASGLDKYYMWLNIWAQAIFSIW